MEPDESPPAKLVTGSDIRHCGTDLAHEEKDKEGGAGVGVEPSVTPAQNKNSSDGDFKSKEIQKQSPKGAEYPETVASPHSGDALRPMLFAMGLVRCALALDIRGFLFLGCFGVWTSFLEGSLLFVGFAGLVCPSVVPDLAILCFRTPNLEQQAHILNHLRGWNILQFRADEAKAVSVGEADAKKKNSTHRAPDLEKEPHAGEDSVCKEENVALKENKKDA